VWVTSLAAAFPNPLSQPRRATLSVHPASRDLVPAGNGRGAVVIVEDAESGGVLVAELVEAEGFSAVRVATPGAATTALGSKRAVAVIVEWSMPGPGGADICRQLRGQDEMVPIMFISERADEHSIVRAFDAGADDYVVIPFRNTELVVRLESNIRRVAAFQKATPQCQCASAKRDVNQEFGEVTVDFVARIVLVGGETISFSPLEFRLLEFMARNEGRAFSRDQLMSGVYGYSADISTDRIDVLVRRVRKRLGDGPLRGEQLVTVPGFGYRLDQRRSATA
jgi:two-component system response regulator MtrA